MDGDHGDQDDPESAAGADTEAPNLGQGDQGDRKGDNDTHAAESRNRAFMNFSLIYGVIEFIAFRNHQDQRHGGYGKGEGPYETDQQYHGQSLT